MAKVGARALALASLLGIAVTAAPPDSGQGSMGAVGPQVGARVPGFALPDQDGRVRSLDSLGGPRGLMLVFFRSADW